MNARCDNPTGKNLSYEGVKVKMSRADFVSWATPLFRQFEIDYPKEIPSIDRIDDGHYEFGNIQVISLADNVRKKQANKNECAPSGMAWCSHCECYSEIENFDKNSRRKNGVSNLCKTHKSEERKIRTGVNKRFASA